MARARRTTRVALALSAALVAPPAARAQATPAGPAARDMHGAHGGIFGVQSDNDYYDFRVPPQQRGDWDYTNGARLVAILPGTHFLPRHLAGGAPPCLTSEPTSPCTRTALELGQEIYTPYYNWYAPVPGERPYAGWLYAATAVTRGSARRSARTGLTLGITGPPSLGAAVQQRYHELVRYPTRVGWSNQLHTEPAFALSQDRALVAAQWVPRGVRIADLVADGGATLGTLRTAARAGGEARMGWGLAHPWGGPGAAPRTRFSLWAAAGARRELVLRDLFIDGNTFRDGPHAERRPWVTQRDLTLGARVGRLSGEYRLVRRTREYERQVRVPAWGSLTLALRR